MIVLAVILVVIILIALLRFGVSAEYGESGILATAHAGPISIRIFPREAKEISAKKKAKIKAKKAKKALKAKAKPKVLKPGGLKGFLDIVTAVKNTLGRLRRRLLIKKLIIYITIADKDPSKTATMFGTANAALDTFMPVLEKIFRIKRRDIRTAYDFEAGQPTIYVNTAISLAVWEAVYIVFAILPALIKMRTKKTTGKDEKKYGEASDKRADGDDNAESQGND